MENRLEIKVLGSLAVRRFSSGKGWQDVKVGGWEPPALLALLAAFEDETSRDELFRRIKGPNALAGHSGDASTYEWTRSLRRILNDDKADTFFPSNRRRTMYLRREAGVKVDYDEFKRYRKDGQHQTALDLVRGDYAENLVRVDLSDIRERLLDEVNDSRIAIGLPRVDSARRAKSSYGGHRRSGLTNPRFRQMFALEQPDDRADHITARYRLHLTSPGLDPHHVAAELAATTGVGSTIDLPWFAPENMPVITGITDLGHRQHAIEVAYPLEALSTQPNLPHLLTMLTLPAEYALTRYIWLDDVYFPPSLIVSLGGPRFGTNGLREKLGVEDRPLFSVIIKPRYGFVTDRLEQALAGALAAGADGIVDDELLVDPPGDLAFHRRIDRISRLVSDSTERKYYIPNITAPHDAAVAMLQFVADHDLPAVTINPFAIGYGSFQSLIAAASDMGIAVVDCSVGAGLISRPDAYSGISRAFLAKLSRLVGADAVHSGSEGEHWHSERLLRAIHTNLSAPLAADLRPSLPVIAGGVTVANVWRKLSAFGSDCMANVGGGVWSYPGGPASGAEALAMIVREVSMDLEPEDAQNKLAEISRNNKTLREALRMR